MINKEKWIILPYSVAKKLPGLRLSPPGVVSQRGRRPRWIVDYSWWDVNKDTLPIAPNDAMQFGHALDRTSHDEFQTNKSHPFLPTLFLFGFGGSGTPFGGPRSQREVGLS